MPPELVATTGEHCSYMKPKASLFLCHTLRSGSTLLCDALSATGVAGHAEEYFPERSSDGTVFVSAGAALTDPDIWRSDWTTTPFEQCLDRAFRCGTTPNGVFAAKVKWANVPYLGEMLGAAPERGGLSLAEHVDSLFPNLRYVWVTRRDKVRQAVSLVKARQSSEWKAMSGQPQRSDVASYNFRLVELALRGIVDEECAWAEYFTRAGVTPFTVVYEDLVRNYESTVRGLLDHLRIPLSRGFVFPAPRLHKQADRISEAWVERYREDAVRSAKWRKVLTVPSLLTKRHLRDTYVVPRLRTSIDHLWDELKKLRSRLTLPQPPWHDNRLLTATRSRRRLGPVLAVVVVGFLLAVATALQAKSASPARPVHAQHHAGGSADCHYGRAEPVTACSAGPAEEIRHRI